MEKIKNYLPIITLLWMFILLVKSCGISSEISRMNKTLNQKIDSVGAKVFTQKEMESSLKNTPLWKTLEIEELSDKNRMPINHYKNEIENR